MVIKRSYSDCYHIDDSPMLMPDADVEITYEDLEDGSSGYDESGFYHRSTWKRDVRTWKFKYSVLTKEEYGYIRHLLKGKNTFTFKSLDEQDLPITAQAYCRPYSVVYQSKRSGLYKNLTLEIVEC